MREGNMTKTEWILLGMTAFFLCGLLGLAQYDRAARPAVETEKLQEAPLPEVTALNLNTATAEELMELPGIGAELARRIIEYRTTNGGFQSAEELMQVSGIGEKTFAGLKERITVEGTA